MIPRSSAGSAWLFGVLSLALTGCGAGGIAPSLSGATPPTTSTSVPAAVSTGPQLGYLWSGSDHSLMPVLGVPGASQVGQAVTGSGGYVGGAASARSSIALLVEADGSLDTMTLPSGTPQRVNGTSVATAAQIVFSPLGQNAVAFAPGGTAVTLVTGLGTSPQVQNLISAGAVASAAVSDTAQVAVASGSSPVSVALLTGSKGAVASLGGFGGVGFLPGSDDLLVADSGGTAVTLVRHSSTAPATQSFSSALIQSPIAVAASQDGQWAVVANSADQSVVRLDLTGATEPLRIACACQPALLAPLGGNAVFRITALGSGPTWLVDASAAVPRTFFIPAVKP